jgi:hypothetical protein
MLEVEGKIFHKLVEIKNYRTSLYLNYCDINQKDRHILGLYVETKQKDKFFSDAQFYTEDAFVKHFGNPFASVHFDRQRLFIEEGDDKISLKFQFYRKTRKVGGKYFTERKVTNYLTFNFKKKMFYSGTFSTKKKQVIGRSMKVNPTYFAIETFLRNIRIESSVAVDQYLYFFLEKIWDRMGIENPQNFQWGCMRSFYSLTYYLVNGIKIPNNWRKFAGIFFSKKELRKFDMNLVDTAMDKLKHKGSTIKQIFNEMEWIDFDRLYLIYNLLGIDRFNKIENKIFDEYFTTESNRGDMKMDENKMGRYYECFYSDKGSYPSHLYDDRILVPLTPKEKDRIADLIPYLGDYRFSTLLDHLDMKRDLINLGENVKFKFTNISSFNLEHEEFSRLLQSYRKGEVERFYGDVDILETPIEHEGETYYPVLFRKTADYEKESQHQRNCVRGYSERPDCMIFSIRKGSVDGDERITVEYQFRQNEILNVQERAKFNELPSADFSQVARIQLANINLMYKLGTLKLPKLIKKYRSGKVIEQQSVFNSADVNYGGDKSYGKIIRLTPSWDTCTPEFSYWDEGYMIPVRDYDNYVDDFFDDLP